MKVKGSQITITAIHPKRNMNECNNVVTNQSHSCQDISLKNTNINLVALKEKQLLYNHKDLSSGHDEKDFPGQPCDLLWAPEEKPGITHQYSSNSYNDCLY